MKFQPKLCWGCADYEIGCDNYPCNRCEYDPETKTNTEYTPDHDNEDNDPHEDYLNCAKCGRMDCSDLMKPWEEFDASKRGFGFLCSICWKTLKQEKS